MPILSEVLHSILLHATLLHIEESKSPIGKSKQQQQKWFRIYLFSSKAEVKIQIFLQVQRSFH